MTEAAGFDDGDGTDPWTSPRRPGNRSLGGLIGDMSSGQRYTTVISVTFAVLVVVFGNGPVEDDASFLAGVTDGRPAAVEAGLVPASSSVPAPVTSPSSLSSAAPAAAELATSPSPTSFDPGPAPSGEAAPFDSGPSAPPPAPEEAPPPGPGAEPAPAEPPPAAPAVPALPVPLPAG